MSMTVLPVCYVKQNELQDSLCVHCVVPQLSAVTVRTDRRCNPYRYWYRGCDGGDGDTLYVMYT